MKHTMFALAFLTILNLTATGSIASSYELSVSATAVQPGASLTVTWTAPAGSSARDWVTLIKVGAPNQSFIVNKWVYTNGATSGSFKTFAPTTPGNYEFRYLLNNGYTDVKRSNPISVGVTSSQTPIVANATPTASYNLSTSASSVKTGANLTVSWTAPAGSSTRDWVTLIKVGEPNQSFIVNKWVYTNGATSGTFSTSAPTSPGNYEFRYLLNNGYTDVKRSSAIAVGNLTSQTPLISAYNLTTSAASVQTGASISVTWTAPAGTSTQDWVSLYKTGDSNQNFMVNKWVYTNGTPSNSYITTAPTTPGTYEFRYLLNNGYTDVKRSAPITVTYPQTVMFGGASLPTPTPVTTTTPSSTTPPSPTTPLPGSIFVATTGSDSNNGTQSQPFRTIQKAANVAKAGDVIRVAAGTYNERITVPTSGTATNPIVFQGDAGAIVDGGDLTTGWSASTSCAGVFYKPTSSFGFTPYHASWGDKQLVWIDQSIMNSNGIRDMCQPNGAYWDGIEALAGNAGGYTYIRYRDGRNPNDGTVRISPSKTGVFNLVNKSYIRITGFIIKNGYYVINLDGGSNNIVEQNNIFQGAYIVHLTNRANSNTIRKNSISQNFIYADFGHPRDRSNADYNALNATRVIGNLFGVGIAVNGAGSGNEISENHVYGVMAGVWIAGGPDPAINSNTTLASNTFENCADFCVLLHQGSMANLQVKDNAFHEYHNGIRFGPIYHGPVYLYRNRFSSETQNSTQATDIVFSLFGSNFPASGVYFYHNSFGSYAYTLSLYGETLVNSYWINNAFSSSNFIAGSAGPRPQIFGYNWIGGAGAYDFVGPNNRVATNQSLWDRRAPSFSLAGDSSARQIGLDLSQPWTANGVAQPALPGAMAGYFSGSKPNAGAVQ